MSLPKKSYDIYTFYTLLKESLESKVKSVNVALDKIHPSLTAVGTYKNHVFVVNEESRDLLKLEFKTDATEVSFGSAQFLSIANENDKFAQREKEIVNNIIEALADDEHEVVEHYKKKLLTLTKEKLRVERIVNEELPKKQNYVSSSLKETVGDLIESASDELKQAIAATKPSNNLLTRLMEGETISVSLYEQPQQAKQKDSLSIIKENIISARKSAKNLPNNSVFFESVVNIQRRKDEAEDYFPVVEDMQEFYCLTRKEQFDAISEVYDKAEMVVTDDRVNEIVSYLNKLAELKIPEEINRLNMVVGNYNNESFAKQIGLLEAELNQRVYANIDLSELHNLLVSIIAESNDILAPEMLSSLRKALAEVNEMMESGLTEDGRVQSIVNLVRQFTPDTFGEGKMEPDLEDDENADKSIDAEEKESDVEEGRKKQGPRGPQGPPEEDDEEEGGEEEAEEEAEDEEGKCKNGKCLTKKGKAKQPDDDNIVVDDDGDEVSESLCENTGFSTLNCTCEKCGGERSYGQKQGDEEAATADDDEGEEEIEELPEMTKEEIETSYNSYKSRIENDEEIGRDGIVELLALVHNLDTQRASNESYEYMFDQVEAWLYDLAEKKK